MEVTQRNMTLLLSLNRATQRRNPVRMRSACLLAGRWGIRANPGSLRSSNYVTSLSLFLPGIGVAYDPQALLSLSIPGVKA